MFETDQYELLDFGSLKGQGAKLERLGGYLISRPCPAAESKQRRNVELWKECDATFSFSNARQFDKAGERGKWNFQSPEPKPWLLCHGNWKLNLRTTPFGHVGAFVEQQENWDWISKKVQAAGKAIKVLNLFAYTGGSTLAAAAAGAEVVHIDSAKNIVQWARENAELSGMAENPIRWIVEDCQRFVARELKRGNRYDAIILDPPSFGHGPKGEVWKIDRDLIELLRNCRQLLSDSPVFFLLSCHSPGLGVAELQATVCDSIFGTCSAQVVARPLELKTQNGRALNAGNVVRWPR